MNIKMFEVRDRNTLIPVLAIQLRPREEVERFLLARAGYGYTPNDQAEYIFLCKISGGTDGQYDPFLWGDRTMLNAHLHIAKHFEVLKTGDVVDVEFLLQETRVAKQSERFLSGPAGITG